MWDIETDSTWSPFDGAAMEGPPKGTVMPRIPCLQTTWKEWLALHPDTDVMVWDPWPTHTDARHGHGTIKWVGSAGVEPMFIGTIECGELDNRLAENAIILGVQAKGVARAYPLLEIRKGNNVVDDEIGGEEITLWAEPSSHTMGAYQRSLDGQTLTFQRQDGAFKDAETGSTWNIEGVATSGKLAGKRLTHADWHFMEWHTWSSYHRPSEIYVYPEGNKLEPEPADLARLVRDLRAAGCTVEPEAEYIYARLPLCAQRGLTASVDGKRLSFFVFRNENDASDYGAFREHATQAGIAAVESDPSDEDVYTDPTFAHRKPEAEISHSNLVNESAFLEIVENAIGGGADSGGEKTYREIFAALTAAGYEATVGGDSIEELVPDADFMNGYILPARAINGAWARIEGGRFMVIRFPDAASAEAYAAERGHRVAAGNVVFRSDPDGQYRVPFPVATFEVPDDKVEWSTLPENADFLAAATAAIGA